MSNKIFVHYPAYLSEALRTKFDRLIRSHPVLGSFGDHVNISSTPHEVRIVKGIEPFQARRGLRNYLLYATLFILTKFSFPPPPRALRKRPLYREDKWQARYHFYEIDDCAVGVFVPSKLRKWPYYMWRNCRRLMQQQKEAWQIIGDDASGWRIVLLEVPPPRSLRQNRDETFIDIVEYAEPRVYPSLYTLIRDAFKERN